MATLSKLGGLGGGSVPKGGTLFTHNSSYGNYTVPAGKTLVIVSVLAHGISQTGLGLGTMAINFTGDSVGVAHFNGVLPLMSGQTFSLTGNGSVVGYLIDN